MTTIEHTHKPLPPITADMIPKSIEQKTLECVLRIEELLKAKAAPVIVPPAQQYGKKR